MRAIILTAVISALISGGVVSAILGILGKRWLAGVESRHAQKLEAIRAKYSAELERSKQLLQSEVDKTFLVTKVHFETEFQALKEVFALLAELRLQMPNIRPTQRIVPANETRQQRLEELDKNCTSLQTTLNKLASVSENLSPFYPHDIYLPVEECSRIVRAELAQVALSDNREVFTSAWTNAGQKNFESFVATYGKVSELIRDRISKLAILRST
jgi:hypothetical protein